MVSKGGGHIVSLFVIKNDKRYITEKQGEKT